MDINSLPTEILWAILEATVKANESDGITFSYGLIQLPPTGTPPNDDKTISTRVQRYVRGPLPPYQLKWDATSQMRLVCRRWHDWSLEYALHSVYVKLWRGSEKWCDLTSQREKYPLYEMIEYPRGEKVFRDQYSTLRNTRRFLESCPSAASNVRRLWFNGLYVPETDAEVVSILRSCTNLKSASLPWTILRHASADDWAAVLSTHGNQPLESLELLAVSPPEHEAVQIATATLQQPLLSQLVDFSGLKKLKLYGNTDVMPVCDEDLKAIARTATRIEEFQLTGISTVTIDGVMAIVRSSRKTLRVLEHSPRSDDGFWHPHPGHPSDGSHICSVLASCPKLEDLSVSIPTMCHELFSNTSVRWKNDCQVRALGFCGDESNNASHSAHDQLRQLLNQARKLVRARGSGYFPAELTLELFFADMIFDPHLRIVHGDFQRAEEASGGSWPVGEKKVSRKGPYGSTGLYGKEEEFLFECVGEDDLFAALALKLVWL